MAPSVIRPAHHRRFSDRFVRLQMARAWLLTSVAFALANGQSSSVKRDVTIDQGTVRGFRSTDGAYYSFLGIPYATAPTGFHRFQAPLRAPSWEGVFESTYENILCPQTLVGEEHCLVMNVFAPIAARAELLPVLVYIHGGAFILGSGPTYGVGNLLDRGMIVVSFNYRLGALGFLCLGTDEVPGNAGMKDQVEALRWVNRNIASFGGDPNAVTIYGTSAGGASVELLILSNVTNGLFHRAISESGSALLPWAVDRDPLQTARNVAQAMGFSDAEDLPALTDFYKRVQTRRLSNAAQTYQNEQTDTTIGFVPCIERPSATAFLVDSPLSILKSGNYRPVPYIIAFCNMEGFMRVPAFYDYEWKEKLEANCSAFLPVDMRFDSEQVRNAIAEEVKAYYFGQRSVSEWTIQAYIDYFGDTTFLRGILQSALLHARYSQQTYLMEFAYAGRLNQEKKYFSYIAGAGHADIYPYAFRDFKPSVTNDLVTVERITALWSNFVKHGDPTPAATPLVPAVWRAVEPAAPHYMYFGRNLNMRLSPYDERAQFWERLYRQHYAPITAPAPAQPD